MFYVKIVIGFISFFSIGWIFLAWPERVQDYVIRFYLRHTMLARINPLLWWVRTSWYRLQLRVVGVLMILASFIILIGVLAKE